MLNQVNSGNVVRDLAGMFDFIYTPGSMLDYVKQRGSNDGIGKVVNYSFATLGEGIRLAIYGAMTLVSPIVPLSFLLGGLLGKTINNRNNLEATIQNA